MVPRASPHTPEFLTQPDSWEPGPTLPGCTLFNSLLFGQWMEASVLFWIVLTTFLLHHKCGSVGLSHCGVEPSLTKVGILSALASPVHG